MMSLRQRKVTRVRTNQKEISLSSNSFAQFTSCSLYNICNGCSVHGLKSASDNHLFVFELLYCGIINCE